MGSPRLPNSSNHACRTWLVWDQSGTVRSLRPFPLSWRNVEGPKQTCSRCKVVASDTRAPLLYRVSKKGIVATPAPARAIGSGQQGLNFRSGEIPDELFIRPFAWNGQHLRRDR